MFTVKFYRDGDRETYITTADELTVRQESFYLRGITCHHSDKEDVTWYAGIVTKTTAYVDAEHVFEKAIVENSDGRTSEVYRCRAIPPVSETIDPPDEIDTTPLPALRATGGGR